MVSDLIRTLPEDDAWRHLSARIGGVGTEDMQRGQIPRPPDKTGALRRGGQPFGTYEDSTDLHQPVFSNLDIDIAFVALMEPLAPEASALIAFAADGWRVGIEAARKIREAAITQSADVPDGVEAPDRWIAARAGDVVYQAGVEAIRWAAHRRRAYVGMEDPWVLESCFSWSWRADRISAGTGAEDMYREIEDGILREMIRTDRDDDF